MIQFTRLRINGFKSFVDRTELDIGPGLNGVVGPNGCGKSNLVEALRWVMGENSAKRMRGGGMEDVIFNGTAKRSKRNIAEVSLLLDNSTRSAPAAYNSSDEVEVLRKIERDHGSNYRVNGKTVRARDVQMLFADTVTGANSPAMVSQGRITQIINAKPINRRLVLEESAGISGLFARRHEAELRLKAADGNLVRIEDILGSMEGRLSSLKRQARQATKYRNVSTQIRQLEILIAYAEWKALEEKIQATREKFNEAESQVAERLATVTQLTKTQTTQAEDLPTLRQKEAELAAALQTQKLALQRLEDESGRIDLLIEEAKTQLEQTRTDLSHEENSGKESAERLERLEEEHTKIVAEQGDDEGQLEKKETARQELEDKVSELEERYTALMQGTAEAKARKEALAQRIGSNEQRIETVTNRISNAEEELKTLEGQTSAPAQDYDAVIQKLESEIDIQQKTIEKTQSEIETLSEKIETARLALKDAESHKSEFSTEINVLESILNTDDEGEYTPVLNSVSADTGFERVLSRALGDSLMASLDEKASSLWLEPKTPRASLPDLPIGTESLKPHVKAPKALDAALSQIGVVEDDATGEELWTSLAPGQALVSKDGTYWRWDGYCIKSGAADRHAQQLEQQNKLKDLLKKQPAIEKAADEASDALQTLLQKEDGLRGSLREFQDNLRETQSTLTETRAEWSAYREENAKTTSEISSLKDTLKLSREDQKELQETLEADQKELQILEDTADDNKEEQLSALKDTLNEARQSHAAAVRAYDIFIQERNTRNARLQAIGDERVNLQNRSIRSRERVKELSERSEALTEKLKTLNIRPDDFEEDKAKLLNTISEMESRRSDAAEKLAEVETAVADTGRALKEAENALGNSREARAHAQATLAAIQDQHTDMGASIQEQFEMAPHDLPKHSAVDVTQDMGGLDALRQQKERAVRERDQIGPVNLRAEDEAQELEKEVTTLLNERNDLVQAIEELRGGIQKINKEARERLVTAFEHVNAHFQRLFVRLFGGGQAHLELVDSDDPLEAGLEIFAQPPGKTLQSLSLLSGGEQTMASIALIFAMFLTNPSPICVLDEIDAPLDDANVDRVCDLLEEIAERGETRFVIITHHRLTMARMDRLYGVTMAEKGVSQLVSVDLQQSFDFLDEAA